MFKRFMFFCFFLFLGLLKAQETLLNKEIQSKIQNMGVSNLDALDAKKIIDNGMLNIKQDSNKLKNKSEKDKTMKDLDRVKSNNISVNDNNENKNKDKTSINQKDIILDVSSDDSTVDSDSVNLTLSYLDYYNLH
jgi:hypothetical protein